MAREPEDAVIGILPQIQATQAEHSKQLARIDERFENLDQKMGELNDGMITAFGLASHANVRDQGMQKEINDIKKRLKRLEAKRQ